MMLRVQSGRNTFILSDIRLDNFNKTRKLFESIGKLKSISKAYYII